VRRCKRCGEEKPLDDFSQRKRGQRETYCRPCNSARMKEWRQKHPHKSNRGNYARSVKRRYGVTLDDVAAMREAQGGCCPICTKPFTRTPHVDHDHDTGRVRALLCGPCNIALGFIERPEWLRAAMIYLNRHSQRGQ
jgi:hypothetical protein